MYPSYLEWHDEQDQLDLPDDPFPCSVQDAEARPHARVIKFKKKKNGVKQIYNKHPRDIKFLAIVDRLMLLQKLTLGRQNGGRCRNVVVIQGWSFTRCSSKAYFVLYNITFLFAH